MMAANIVASAMQPLETMLAPIQRALRGDALRASAAGKGRVAAVALSQRLPLVHRTITTDGPPLAELLSARRLTARTPCTAREVQCGIPRAVYFFLGCGAYPEGAVAFLASSALLQALSATFTPFDTGSLEKHATRRDIPSWDPPDKDGFLREHLGGGADALGFSAEYIAAHFRDPADYVLRPQQSEPDFPAYHGLTSKSGDRRAWSIEVQLHDDLPLDPEHIDAIVLGQPDLLADIPDELVESVVIAEAEGSITPTIHRLITSEHRA
jgi:hypothetical protein